MLKYIFKYELAHWLRSPLTYGFVVIFFALAFVLLIGTAGYFDGPPSADVQVSFLNTPFELTKMGNFFFKIMMFTIPVFVGNAIFRDYDSRTFSILYAFPISKKDYLWGKFGSGFLLVNVMLLTFAIAILSGEFFLGTSNSFINAFSPLGYLVSFGVYILPNALTIGLLIFALVGFTRNIFSGFIVLVLLLLFQINVTQIFFDNHFLLALLDLFGQNSFMLATKDWDLATKNSDALPISNLVIYNRIFWMTFSSFVFYFFYKKFNFQYHPIWVGKNNNNTNTAEEKSAIPTTSKINFDFSFWGKTKAFFYLVRYDFTSIIKYWMFWIVVAFGILTIFFIQRKTVETGDFNLLPLTRLMLFAPLQIYTLVILVVTFLFAGILLGKAKRTKMDTLIDVTPIETAQLLGSKILALSFVQVLMLLLFLGCGVGIQWSNGYTHFELGLYCFQLFLVVLPSLLVWNITSVFVHVLFPNIFVGLFLLLMFWFGVDALPNFGVETYLLRFNQNIPLTYSDFQGFGDQLSGYFLITGYWLVVAVVIILATFLFWNRGSLNTLKERIKNARKRLNRSVWVGMLLAVGSFVFLGFKIYDAEQRGFSLYKVTAHLEKFKATWAIYGKAQQPKIKAIELNLDLFPEENRFVASGTYVLKNESERAMDTLLIRTGFDEKTSVKWSRAVSVLDVDTVMKYQAFILSTPLAVGDSLQLLFEIKSTDNNLFTRNSSVLFNGTFLQYDILPRLHYQFAESKNDKDYNYFSPEANLVQLKTTISTSKDQVAIAPGKLMQENTTEHRREFVYQTQQPIKFNFSFHAGQFLVRAEKYQGIQLETFCLPQHKHNVNEMLQGLKAAIDYNTNLFGKYPYEAIRVVEFPHTEASFSATLTANNIPTSEVMFNINMDAMEGKLNLPFYVMAHELTHEWFSNQVMPADVAGAKMLTESITEYLTLGIYRKSLGAEMAAQFLKIQHQRYHNGRKTERKVEMPLTKVASRQDYIAYGKGAVVFNTLAHRIGEDQMNEILKKYFAEFRGRTKAHPTPKDFIHLMKNEIDSTYYHLVEELFESVIFYNNKITGMNRISSTQVELKITAQKFYNNKSTNLDFKNKILELGQLDKDGELIKVEAVKISSGENVVTVTILEETQRIVLDPNLLVLDENIGDNESLE